MAQRNHTSFQEQLAHVEDVLVAVGHREARKALRKIKMPPEGSRNWLLYVEMRARIDAEEARAPLKYMGLANNPLKGNPEAQEKMKRQLMR